MVTEYQKTTAEVKALVDSGEVKAVPATARNEDQAETVAELGKLQGAEFTKQYHDEQVEAHQDAVDLFKRYVESGDNSDLKAWAVKTLPALQHHLEMAQALDKD